MDKVPVSVVTVVMTMLVCADALGPSASVFVKYQLLYMLFYRVWALSLHRRTHTQVHFLVPLLSLSLTQITSTFIVL